MSNILCKGKKYVCQNLLYKKETCKCQGVLVQIISGRWCPGEGETSFYANEVSLFLGS